MRGGTPVKYACVVVVVVLYRLMASRMRAQARLSIQYRGRQSGHAPCTRALSLRLVYGNRHRRVSAECAEDDEILEQSTRSR